MIKWKMLRFEQFNYVFIFLWNDIYFIVTMNNIERAYDDQFYSVPYSVFTEQDL